MQLNLEFEPGLTERHKSILSCIREAVYKNGKPMKAIAADCDMSESDLSRKLGGNPDDTRKLSACDMVKLIESTGDVTPIHWLNEKFLLNDDQRAKNAATEFMRNLPAVIAQLKAMGVKV